MPLNPWNRQRGTYVKRANLTGTKLVVLYRPSCAESAQIQVGAISKVSESSNYDSSNHMHCNGLLPNGVHEKDSRSNSLLNYQMWERLRETPSLQVNLQIETGVL